MAFTRECSFLKTFTKFLFFYVFFYNQKNRHNWLHQMLLVSLRFLFEVFVSWYWNMNISTFSMQSSAKNCYSTAVAAAAANQQSLSAGSYFVDRWYKIGCSYCGVFAPYIETESFFLHSLPHFFVLWNAFKRVRNYTLFWKNNRTTGRLPQSSINQKLNGYFLEVHTNNCAHIWRECFVH